MAKIKFTALAPLLIVAFCHPCLGLEGVVMTFEAPLFQRPHTDATIVQRLHKGDLADLHQGDQAQDPDFYQTTDRNGHPAYLLKRHIKLITSDEREFEQPITSFGPDLTDYRLQEPLPKGYPFKQKPKSRTLVAINWALPEAQTYPYSQAPLYTNGQYRVQLYLQHIREAILDQYRPRLYFGGFFRFSSGELVAQFANGEEARESSTSLTLGPLLSYDLFRQEEHRLVLSGGIGVDLINSYQVQIQDESRPFQKITVTPLFSFQYQHILLQEKLDLLLGVTCHLILPQKLNSNGPTQNNPLWKGQKAFRRDMFIDLAISVGFQYSL